MVERQEWPALPLIHSFELQPDITESTKGTPSLDEVLTLLATRWEREWLQRQLGRDEAASFLGAELFQKLAFLSPSRSKSPGKNEQDLPVRWLSVLRHAQRSSKSVRLKWRDNMNVEKTGEGWAMALEYYCSRQEWYVHWWPEEKRFAYGIVPLRQIQAVTETGKAAPECVRVQFGEISKARHLEMLIRLPAAYAEEHWRLLCALSCFDKQLEEDEAGNLLVRIWYVEDDYRYLLMRLRSLGRRVEVLEPKRCRAALLADAKIALARYGEKET